MIKVYTALRPMMLWARRGGMYMVLVAYVRNLLRITVMNECEGICLDIYLTKKIHTHTDLCFRTPADKYFEKLAQCL